MPSERATCRTLSTGTPGMLISIALPFLLLAVAGHAAADDR